jgi:hypothetical protein
MVLDEFADKRGVEPLLQVAVEVDFRYEFFERDVARWQGEDAFFHAHHGNLDLPKFVRFGPMA